MVSTHEETLGGENVDLSATVHRIWIRTAEKGNGLSMGRPTCQAIEMQRIKGLSNDVEYVDERFRAIMDACEQGIQNGR